MGLVGSNPTPGAFHMNPRSIYRLLKTKGYADATAQASAKIIHQLQKALGPDIYNSEKVIAFIMNKNVSNA
ncbi:hypothetical protein DRO57_01385 [Candidatus Bathyarchaeota archaeon]|nr:MAG: hypothetical protein DRO57_01385 [Candidatus Bathyarchaeota archaeon]